MRSPPVNAKFSLSKKYKIIANLKLCGKESCYFLVPNKKVTKEVGIGGGLSSLLPHSKPSPSYEPPPRALSDGAAQGFGFRIEFLKAPSY